MRTFGLASPVTRPPPAYEFSVQPVKLLKPRSPTTPPFTLPRPKLSATSAATPLAVCEMSASRRKDTPTAATKRAGAADAGLASISDAKTAAAVKYPRMRTHTSNRVRHTAGDVAYQ